MSDFIFRGNLADIDQDVDQIIKLEAERQDRKLIMIPSESIAPRAVREALGSVFQNIYAEGYPDEDTRLMSEAELLDFPARLGYYRRYADPRYYKGVEYVDTIESLARRRCAEAFATPAFPADRLYANVQPLSGAPANNAVYTALLNPGDTIMGMNLLHGGHLTHGSSANRSGKFYNAVHYTVDPVTEKIDYDAVETLAREKKPKIIIAGYSSYPWAPDWARFRQIADLVGATLLTDVSHIAGLIAAGIIPSPVGQAHVITFTTHKTLCGPRGACILTHDSALAKKIDKAVFPGEQGGPHTQVFAALAVTFKLARTEQFRSLQEQIVKNCVALTQQLINRGFRIPFGGTDTHLTNLDCKTIVGPDNTPLSGDLASRILDIAGIVVNRNTIPGDKSAMNASGIRLGTPWLTQRGFKEKEIIRVADLIADVLKACTPYSIQTHQGLSLRAKINFEVLEDTKQQTRLLAEQGTVDGRAINHGYPHYYFLDDPYKASPDGQVFLDIQGTNGRHFVSYAFSSDTELLTPGTHQATCLITPKGKVDGILSSLAVDHYGFSTSAAQAALAATWLRDLSDGYVAFDNEPIRRLPGPVIIREMAVPSEHTQEKISSEAMSVKKPYFIGVSGSTGASLPKFEWEEKDPPLKKTSLNQVHRSLGAKMVPFAGWDMPVWYSSVVDEHLATRQSAGLFDVSHMGVFQAEGADAALFLDSVCANDIAALKVGESCYTHFLDPEANVIDDTLVYHRSNEVYLVVVNAANDDKDWAWLNQVRTGTIRVDDERPSAVAFGRNVVLRNLRDPSAGSDMRVDIALQGPKSRDILLALGADAASRSHIMVLKRTELCEAVVGGFDLVVSRTGYTGEKMAFELFIHPDQAPDLWNALLRVGAPLGLKPCGLGARDSLRTEAGLPLYGHEMAGELNFGVGEAGFTSYVKLYKPWFIGREAYMRREKSREGVVVRFRFNEKGVRMAHTGDPVLDKKGKVIGVVTSCSIDSEGILTGQAYMDFKSAVEGTPIAIFQDAAKTSGKAPAALIRGERVILPTPAVVISRFPKL